MPAAPAADADGDRFTRHRARRIAAAAGIVRVAPGGPLSDEQLAHLAWHVAAVEPSELRHLTLAPPFPCAQPACLESHQPGPDALDEILPLPHPLDYEWRYDPHTRLLLAELCKQHAGACEPIALLGTPTLAPALRDHRGGVLLLDANAALLTALARASQLGKIQYAAAEIGSFSPPREWRHRAAVVVCDPPWYPQGLATFLRAATRLVRPHGTILLSVPDLLTRPSVARELADLRRLAGHLHLAVTASQPRALRYRTPFFEFRALRAAGLRAVPMNWRGGTLWQLTSTELAGQAQLDRHQVPAAQTATEVTIDSVRIRVIDICPPRPGVVSLQTLVPGDTLPTVSRRHPARTAASLWTSGNTVLGCADPELAGLLLTHLADSKGSAENDNDRLARRLAMHHHVPVCDISRALDKIGAIVATERHDYAAYRAAAG